MKQDSLDALRAEIDRIDGELTALLTARMDCAERVAQIKKARNLPVLHPAREREILARVQNADRVYGTYMADVYRALLDASRSLQHALLDTPGPLREQIRTAREAAPPDGPVACPGTQGAFSHQAAATLYPNRKIRFYNDFAQVFEAVQSGQAAFGVVPVENSTAGSVSDVYDALLRYRHFIVDALDVRIEHHLLGVPGARVEALREVYSHPQALAQCADFIKQCGLAARPFSNTATAAKMVAQRADQSCAAIGSKQAAALYGLTVLKEGVQSVRSNVTRFLSVSKSLYIRPQSNKISLAFGLPHQTGSLNQILTRFAQCGQNLTKIESRPVQNGTFEYQFFLDFTGSVSDEATVRLLSQLQAELPDFSFLGNYLEQRLVSES